MGVLLYKTIEGSTTGVAGVLRALRAQCGRSTGAAGALRALRACQSHDYGVG